MLKINKAVNKKIKFESILTLTLYENHSLSFLIHFLIEVTSFVHRYVVLGR